MEFCPNDGSHVDMLGLSEWSSGVWFYGCKICNTLWEEHGCSVTGRISRTEKSHFKLDEYLQWRQKHKKERHQQAEAQQTIEEMIARIKAEGFPLPVSLDDSIIAGLTDEQRKVLAILQDLTEKENSIYQQINARRPTPSGVLSFPDSSVTICEDEDDFRVITAGLRQQLKQVRAEIKAKLREAIGLGLTYLGIIQRQCANYKAI